MAKYVIRFMPDYNCTSLWPDNDTARRAFNMPIEYDEVNLSESLIRKLEKFDDSVLTLIDWNDPTGPSPISKEEQMNIYNEGKSLFLSVKAELGDDFEIRNCFEWIKPKE